VSHYRTAAQATTSREYELDRIAWNLPPQPGGTALGGSPESSDEPAAPASGPSAETHEEPADARDRGRAVLSKATRSLRARIRRWLGLGKMPAKAPFVTGAPRTVCLVR
jgi:hypothetical protein